jgi:hypothetical protein
MGTTATVRCTKEIYNVMQKGNNYSRFVGLANTNDFIPKTCKVTDMQYLQMYFTDECGQRIKYLTS